MYGYSYIQENDLFDWNENRNRSIEEIKYPMFMYCARCGLIKNIKTESALCPACDISLKPVPGEFLTKTGLMFLSQSARTEFENKIRESAEFDEIAGRQKDSIIAQKEEIHKKEVEERVQEYQASKPQKECPVCHSSSISKISNVGKVVKVGVFGILGAGDLGKTWKCEACGCKF